MHASQAMVFRFRKNDYQNFWCLIAQWLGRHNEVCLAAVKQFLLEIQVSCAGRAFLSSGGGLRRLVDICVLRGQGDFCGRIGVLTDESRHFYRLSSLFYHQAFTF